MEKTIIKTFGNAYKTVTLSEEVMNKYVWVNDVRKLAYMIHSFRITVREKYVGVVNDYIVASYNSPDGEQARKDALRIAEIDMNCIMTYGI